MMLRRMSLTGDAMAHAILPGAAVGYLVSGLSLGAMTIGGLVAGMAFSMDNACSTSPCKISHAARCGACRH